jgi:hypothetical protein
MAQADTRSGSTADGTRTSPAGTARLVALTVIAVVLVLGLLNVFGQRADVDSSHSSAASLLVNSPPPRRPA